MRRKPIPSKAFTRIQTSTNLFTNPPLGVQRLLRTITRHHFSHALKSAYPPDLRSSAPTLRVGLRVLRTLLSSPQRGRKRPNPFTRTSTGQALRATPACGRRIPKCAIKDLRACLRHTRKSTRSRARLIALQTLLLTKDSRSLQKRH